jgi:tetratricopeptide (TPR) repeat protein
MIALYRRAQKMQASLAADHPEEPAHRRRLAAIHHRLGDLLTRANQYAEAETDFTAALALLRPLGQESADELGKTLRSRARLKEATGDFGEAYRMLAEALRLREASSRGRAVDLEFRRKDLHQLALYGVKNKDHVRAAQVAAIRPPPDRTLKTQFTAAKHLAACVLAGRTSAPRAKRVERLRSTPTRRWPGRRVCRSASSLHHAEEGRGTELSHVRISPSSKPRSRPRWESPDHPWFLTAVPLLPSITGPPSPGSPNPDGTRWPPAATMAKVCVPSGSC